MVVVGSGPLLALYFYSRYKEKRNTLCTSSGSIWLMLRKKQEIYLGWVAHGDHKKFLSSNQMFEFRSVWYEELFFMFFCLFVFCCVFFLWIVYLEKYLDFEVMGYYEERFLVKVHVPNYMEEQTFVLSASNLLVSF